MQGCYFWKTKNLFPFSRKSLLKFLPFSRLCCKQSETAWGSSSTSSHQQRCYLNLICNNGVSFCYWLQTSSSSPHWCFLIQPASTTDWKKRQVSVRLEGNLCGGELLKLDKAGFVLWKHKYHVWQLNVRKLQNAATQVACRLRGRVEVCLVMLLTVVFLWQKKKIQICPL